MPFDVVTKMKEVTDLYGDKKCTVCGAKMRFVREPKTTGYVGYVCQTGECENSYSALVPSVD